MRRNHLGLAVLLSAMTCLSCGELIDVGGVSFVDDPQGAAGSGGNGSTGATASGGAGGGSQPVCGNDVIEPGELCDGTDVGGLDCAAFGLLPGGAIACDGCTGWDLSACGGAECSPPGSIMPCYAGPSGTEGVGICEAGARVCLQDGTLGPCQGEVLPKASEDCVTPEDDDCDGTTAPCLCVPGEVSPCYSGPAGTEGVGTCTAGAQTCASDGLSWGACLGETLPAAEACTPAGLDESCNGLVDESCPFNCTTAASGYYAGAGTPADPYQICSCQQLQDIEAHRDASYLLISDVDCDVPPFNQGTGFLPITWPFGGELDGGGHAVSDLMINLPGVDYVGLFTGADPAPAVRVIKNLALQNVAITGGNNTGALMAFNRDYLISHVSVTGTITGGSTVGGLFGESYSGGGIYDSYVSATVTGDSYVGGLTGYTWDGSNNVARRSFTQGSVVASGDEAGGFFGYNKSTMIYDGFSTMSVTGNARVGGIAGHTFEGAAALNVYAAGTVTGVSEVGGLFGRLDVWSENGFVYRCFSAAPVASGGQCLIGNFVGGTLSDLWWDGNVCGQPTSGAPSATVANPGGASPGYFYNPMVAPLLQWDFFSVWKAEAANYPSLLNAGP